MKGLDVPYSALPDRDLDETSEVSLHVGSDSGVHPMDMDRRSSVGEDRRPTTKPAYALLTTVKAICGSGVLALPYSFARLGLVGSLIGMATMAVASWYTTRILVLCLQRVKETTVAESTWEVSYGELGKRATGSAWFGPLCIFSTITCQIGICSSIVVFINQNMFQVVHCAEWMVLVPLSLLLTVLTQLRSVSFLWPTSILGNISIVGAVAAVMYFGFAQHDKSKNFGDLSDVDMFLVTGLPTFFGVGVFTFSGHPEALHVGQTMKQPRDYLPVVTWSYVILFVFYVTFGTLCYLLFGRETPDQILDIMPTQDVTAKILRICMSAVILTSFPINLFPATQIIDDVLLPKLMKRTYREILKSILRLVLVGMIIGVSLQIDGFGDLTAFVGAFSNSLVAFALPPYIYLKLFDTELSHSIRLLNWTVVVLGSLLTIISTILVGVEIISGKKL